MIQEFFDKHIFLYIMGGLCGLGVILKCFLLIVYNKLISSSENMAHTKRNWLKNMKMRFESSYQLQLGVNDVDTYVDKYVSKIKCGGLLLSTWENISGQTIGLCLLTGSFAGILGFIYECGKGPVLFTFFTGAWTAIIVNIVDNIVNISAHKQMLRYNLIDYFENNLKVRMEQEVFHPEARRKYQREYFDEDKIEEHYVESTSFGRHRSKSAKTVAATAEVQEDLSQESGVHSQPEASNDTKLTRKEKKKLSKQEKRQAKRDREQEKLDAKAAKKKEKEDRKQQKRDAKEAKKKEKIDAIEAKKQSKQQAKQAVIDQKNLKRAKREEAREAKERAEIEALQLKKNAKLKSKEQRDHVEQERKQKELQNNKAYKEKMRLKEEKERLAAMRDGKNKLKEAVDSRDIESDYENEEALHEIDESLTKQQVKGVVKEFSKDRIKVVEEFNSTDEDSIEFENEEDREPSEMTAISKEEDMLIEEVLKDFLC